MAAKLKNLKVTKVDFVDEGANPDAHIRLFKSRDGVKPPKEDSVMDNPKFWKRLGSAVVKAFKADGTHPEDDDQDADIAKGGAMSFGDKFKEANVGKIGNEIWDTCYALQSSFCSILNDEELDSTWSEKAMLESLDEFVGVIKAAIGKWSSGRTADVAIAKTEISASDVSMMKSARARLDEVIEKSEAVSHTISVTKNDEPKGDEEEMKIDKSKLTEAERAFLDSIEKRCGTEEPPAQTQQTASADTGAPVAEVTPVLEATVTKSVTQPQALLATETEADDIYKGLNPAVRDEIEALRKFREDAESRELEAVAGKYEIIGKKKEELVPVLKSLKAAGGTAYNDMIAVLDATVEAVNKSGVFSEIGKSGHGSAHVSDAEGKIEGIAKGYMEKEPSLSYTDALAKAWENNPALMDAYDSEEGF